jgi:hypothetical protein
MHPSSFPRVEEFRDRVRRFAGLWRSLLIRAAWATVQGVDMVLFLHASLETKPPNTLVRPKHDPAVADFNTIWDVRPVAAIDPFLDDLKRDVFQAGGRTIKIGLFGGTHPLQQFESASLSCECRFAKRGDESSLDALAFPRASLEMSLSELNRITSNAISDEILKERWNALPAPFDDVNDVLREFFGLERSSQSGGTAGFVNVFARIPIMFGSFVGFDQGKVIVEASAPDTATLTDVSLGRVVRRRNGVPRRSEKNLTLKDWSKRGERRLYRLRESAKGTGGFSAYLKYRGVILDERNVIDPTIHPQNPVLVMHEQFDPKFEFLEKALTPGFNKPNDAFEHAVGWLLGLCGLPPIVYGTVKGLKKAEVDHFVHSAHHKAFVGVECTIDQPNIKDKVAKVYARCHDVRLRVIRHAVIAAIASRLRLDQIPPTEQEIAATNEVALLTSEKLQALLKMARERRSTGEMLNFIVDCIPVDVALRQNPFRNVKRSLRPRYSK